MLKARASNGVFILGIDAGNMARLKAGRPIMVSLAEMGGADDVLLVYGETAESILVELQSATGPLHVAPKEH